MTRLTRTSMILGALFTGNIFLNNNSLSAGDNCPQKNCPTGQTSSSSWKQNIQGNWTQTQAQNHTQTIQVSKIVEDVPSDIVKTAAGSGRFKTLVSLLVAADLSDALKGGQFVVFAPTDDAFAKLPKELLDSLLKPENKAALQAILKYHVIANRDTFRYENAGDHFKSEFKTLNGQNVVVQKSQNGFMVNDSKITTQNLLCSNGSIQVIDSVLIPKEKAAEGKRIPEIAKSTGLFKTLLAALTAAELAEVVNGDGPLTVFAPTDDAFAKIPADTLKSLLQPENKSKLQAILKYHVVAGKQTARDLITSGSAKTVQKVNATIKVVDGVMTINNAKVIKSDIAAENGIIHVIDTVLIPEKK